MRHRDQPAWTLLNHEQLSAELDRCAASIRRAGGDTSGAAEEKPRSTQAERTALDILVEGFSLTPFERAVVLLAAGLELDAAVRELCPEGATFAFALQTFPDAHWSAFAPSSPLRKYGLLDVTRDPDMPLLATQIRISERVLHHLAGVSASDDRHSGGCRPVAPPESLVASHDMLAERVAGAWCGDPSLAVALSGGEHLSRMGIAAAAAARAGRGLLFLDARRIPTDDDALMSRLPLWEREAVLSESVVFIDMPDGNADTLARGAVRFALESIAPTVIAGSEERARPLQRPSIVVDIEKPTMTEQRSLWSAGLACEASLSDSALTALVTQYDLHPSAIRNALDAASLAAPSVPLEQRLWNAARANSRHRLTDLSERIEPCVTWDDLILPDAQREQLRDICRHVSQRARVYHEWGFARRGKRGLGVTALFAGPSGTGKTMAAEILARELELDLHRVDLASVVNKYIGETEKNLRRLFDAAEDGGTLLFFDEADAIFGKRTAIRDSHDRYANIGVDYLLQRMESYRGLAVLATNSKASLDAAFVRRIRFIVDFPFPNRAERSAIWQAAFPPAMPRANIDFDRLARLSLAGGSIRNIALAGAFRAAEDGCPLNDAHLTAAARAEFGKLERPIPAEFYEAPNV